MTNSVTRARLVRAVAIVAVAVFAVPSACFLLSPSESLADTQMSASGISAREVIGNTGDVQGFLDRAEQASSAKGGPLPELFEQEVGLPLRSRDVRVDESGTVVGCTVDADAGEVLAGIRLEMEKRGWHEVPLGEIEGSTFVKNMGSYSWVLVTCTQVGNSTSVVFRCVQR